MKRDDAAALIFDLLILQPQGVTLDDLAALAGMNRGQVRRAIGRAREIHGDNDSVNITCEPDPTTPRGQWPYRLVARGEDSRWWQANRMRDSETRLRTQLAVAKSVARNSDGRTLEGKRARIQVRHLERLLEDLAELTA